MKCQLTKTVVKEQENCNTLVFLKNVLPMAFDFSVYSVCSVVTYIH